MFELILFECISYPSRRPARHVAADAPTAAVAAASTAARIIRHRTPDCPAPHGARRCERRALRVEGAGSIERHARRGSSTSSSHRRRPRPRPTAVLPRLLAGAHCAVFSVKMSKPPSSQDPYGWRGGWGAASIAQSRQHKQFESPTSGVAPPKHHHRRAVLPRPTPLQPDTPHYVADGKKGLTAQTVVATNPRARKQRPVRGGGGVEMRQAPVGSVGSQFQELSPSRPVRPLVHIAPPRTSEHIAIDAGVVPSRSACGRTS